MTWVKICATTNLDDALASVAAGANALGFIFAPSTRRIEAQAAAEIVEALPAGIEKIGIFVDERPECMAEIAQRVGLTGVQLHGDEPAAQLPSIGRCWASASSSRRCKHANCWQRVAIGSCRIISMPAEASTPSCSIRVCRANVAEPECHLTGNLRCRSCRKSSSHCPSSLPAA